MVINNTPQRPDKKAVLVSSWCHCSILLWHVMLFPNCYFFLAVVMLFFFYSFVIASPKKTVKKTGSLSQEIQIYTKVIISRDHDFYHVKYHVCVCTKIILFSLFHSVHVSRERQSCTLRLPFHIQSKEVYTVP